MTVSSDTLNKLITATIPPVLAQLIILDFRLSEAERIKWQKTY